MTDNTVYEVIDRVDTPDGGPTSSFYEKTAATETTGPSTPDDTAYTVVDRVDTQAGSPTSSFFEASTVYEDLALSDNVLVQSEAARDAALAAQAASEAAAASIVPTVNAAVLVETNARIAADAAVTSAFAAADVVVTNAYIAADAVVTNAFTAADALKANLASPAFTGNPTAPTPSPGDNDTSIATTAFATAADTALQGTINTALALKAPLASPTFTGTPAAPTATAGTNTTQLATTAFVDAARVILAAATALKANTASPTFTGTPAAPTASPGTNTTQLATTAFVEAARVILAAADALKAPLASPALTGTPTAPTAAPGTNTTQLATTAFAAALGALKADLASPTFTGVPAAPTATVGTNTTQLATTAFVLANAGSGGGAPPEPQGRLTLQSTVPVMVTTQSAKTTIYYTPAGGSYLPLYNGTAFVSTAFTELSVATTDTSKNPAAIGASKMNDWFVWDDAGTLRLSHGPDWTNDTTRSAGTALTKVNGVLLNSVAITNGPAASRGTYVGTTHSNASSQLDWNLGGAASGGSPALLCVWNMYNRVPVRVTVEDTFSNATATSGTIAAFNGSSNNRVSIVNGLADEGLMAYAWGNSASGAGGLSGVAVGVDSTSAITGLTNQNSATGVAACSGIASVPSAIGFHYFQLLQYAVAANATVYGSSYIASLHSGLIVDGRF